MQDNVLYLALIGELDYAFDMSFTSTDRDFNETPPTAAELVEWFSELEPETLIKFNGSGRMLVPKGFNNIHPDTWVLEFDNAEEQ